MSVVKIAAGFAGGITILLFVLAGTTQNPEIALYEKTVKMMMEEEGLTSVEETEQCFPVLIDIQSDMSRIDALNQIVENTSRNPAPMISEDEALRLHTYMQRIHQLRKGVRTELSRLIATYAEGQLQFHAH